MLWLLGDWTYKVEHPDLPEFNIYISLYRMSLSVVVSGALLYLYGRVFADLQKRKRFRKTIREKLEQVERTRNESVLVNIIHSFILEQFPGYDNKDSFPDERISVRWRFFCLSKTWRNF